MSAAETAGAAAPGSGFSGNGHAAFVDFGFFGFFGRFGSFGFATEDAFGRFGFSGNGQ